MRTKDFIDHVGSMKTELMRQVVIEQYKSHKIEPYRDYESDLTFKEWLEMEIDNNPEGFDPFFDRSWDELTEDEQEIRSERIFDAVADMSAVMRGRM